MNKTARIVMMILFYIAYVLIAGVMIFYVDISNGPFVVFISLIVLLAVFLIGRILFFNAKKIKIAILWCLFLIGGGLIVIISHPCVAFKKPVYYMNPRFSPIVMTNKGALRGILNEDSSVSIYPGIPYAKAPVGELRWKEPQDIEKYQDGFLELREFKSKSYQPRDNEIVSSLVDIYAQGRWVPDYRTKTIEPISEDSLYLNLWRPNNNEKNLPVIVYIHGGSLTTGSAAFEDYNGEEMAKKGVIMITVAYRLGVFGYFANEDLMNESPNHTTGNYGLLDQIKALEWVHNNIGAFGGDKDNITIAGESAGSSSVSAICASPLAKGLFKRAIAESSSLVVKKAPHTYRTMTDALNTGKEILKEFNVSSVAELRNIAPERLVTTKFSNSSMTLDGYALTKDPYQVYLDHENNEVELLNEYNVKESDAFVIPKYLFNPTNKNNFKERLHEIFDDQTIDEIMKLYESEIEKDAPTAFNEIISVWWFMYPHHSWSRVAKNNGVKVYRYQFTKTNGYYSTYHSGEMIYAYGNVKNSRYPYRYNDTDIKLSNNMLDYWSNFVKTGNPNREGLTEWTEWNNTDNKVMEFGDNVGMIDDKYLKLYDIFDNFLKV